MKHPEDKGAFATNIGDDVLKEALEAVEKRTGGKSEEAEAVELEVGAPEAAPAAVDPRDAELGELRQQVEFSSAKGRELMAKLKDEHEKMLRAAADLDNFKKRAAKEKEEVQRFGIEKLLKDLLPVFDNFDRALEAARSPGDFESLKKGVEMIRKLFEDTLGRHGVKSFVSKGELFDPNRHEAMSAAETTEVPPNHVLAEMVRGFTLNERLVRPALVVVARAPSTAAEASSGDNPPSGGQNQ